MGMDNILLVLNKSKNKVEQLKRFIEEVCDSDENSTSEYKLVTYGIEVKQYDDFWGMETCLRNTTVWDLEYWLNTKDKNDIVNDSLIIVNYDYNDSAEFSKFFSDESVGLFDVFDGTLYEEGKPYTEGLPMEDIMKYFSYTPYIR